MHSSYDLDASVWGPHYWFFLHTISKTYPSNPNEVSKRKYYDLIQNMPLFIPNEKHGNNFAKMLDKYPVSPYLVSKSSFCKWVHFIHNKMNLQLNKKELSYLESIDEYDKYYLPKIINDLGIAKYKKHLYYFIIAITMIVFLYKNK